jgi:hypothetical protein
MPDHRPASSVQSAQSTDSAAMPSDIFVLGLQLKC